MQNEADYEDVKKTIVKQDKRKNKSVRKALKYSPLAKAISPKKSQGTIGIQTDPTGETEQSFIYNPHHESYFYDDEVSHHNETIQQSIHEPILEQSYLEYLQQFPPLVAEYINARIQDSDNVYDTYYLRHEADTDTIRFGDSIVNFTEKYIIISKGIEERKYNLTKGLLELLFKSIPDRKYVNAEDDDNFTDIIFFTNAHRRNFNANQQIQGTRSDKYTFTIKPILEKVRHDEKIRESERLQKLGVSKLGAGFNNINMIYNNKPNEYIYWDNPNELVERLKLLLASTSAGNNSHQNEINSIIEELREANIIY